MLPAFLPVVNSGVRIIENSFTNHTYSYDFCLPDFGRAFFIVRKIYDGISAVNPQTTLNDLEM